ncbi:HigA family addiction module antitoxin [Roseobacter sp. CCS2]|uniref:HigA family addiction module antitoxin n=1 Tax=Roseobacter sp. CCS2 TaxID=391593 RepID=UPI0000F4053D|nr:HigA family addiction module antitoxin [Roseobacter sp. CCS2]EBA13650.1 putative plasmid maintenance system antidote protein, XRE family [Roseobacter sp. CCS2]
MIKLSNAVHPGEVLAEEFLKPADIDVISFSREAEIDPQTAIALIEGRIGITEMLAGKLAPYFGNSVGFWLKLQENYQISAHLEQDSSSQRNVDHPDQHEIDDWVLNGPKNAKIVELVRDLTLDNGLRLAEVESFIVTALEKRRRLIPNAPTQSEGG